MRIWLTSLCAILLSCFSLQAQQDTLHMAFSVQGKVIDADSGRPVESVLVSVPGATVATVTNADGRFVIKSARQFGKVHFSHIGYNTVVCDVTEGTPLTVRMIPLALTLEEAVIVSGDPLDIINAAIKKIPANYGIKPTLSKCFYRETVRKRTRYTYISEAVARMYKNGYDEGVWRDRVALEKSRVLISQRVSDTLSVKVQGGPAQAQYLDIVKNHEMLLNRETLEQYKFEMGSPTYINGRLQFVIKFSPSGTITENALYYGTMYIDRERLFFTRIEMSMDMSDPLKATRQIVVKKPFSLRFHPKEMSILVNYGFDGEMAQMTYFRSTFRFNCDWKKKLFATSYTAVNELVVTDRLQPVTQIPKDKVFRTSDILSEKAAEFMDPDFWKDYNIIEPTESLEHAVSRLRKQK
ncbi:MAG: carboxypeptidase-like regulatory domain-containing protein [Bacteroidales bacterium]|nr:carboxypeptidase-like regulatory domain-containing protein [Bacteroidales bacterium]